MKEISFVEVNHGYGGDQNLLDTYFQRLGACGAVTALDTCLCLAKNFEEFQVFLPKNQGNITQEAYQTLMNEMRLYLRPRLGGIDRLETYRDGLLAYCNIHGVSPMVTLLSAENSYADAEALMRQSIDAGYPVAFLLLKHQDKVFEEFTWHWFLITGYEMTSEGCVVQIATFGKRHQLSLSGLWHCGDTRKGGMVVVAPKERKK